ncbi:MAG: tetratricopeptide repeat protein [Treponema sp.]|nr:tetratricopeptide repeat protein [Treponema sp.]
MPGLSQLIQFNKDILSLGDEIQIRAQRGEKPVRVPVPKVPDTDDSDEFVMGMPENEAIVQDTSVDDDLSDLQAITGIGQPSSEESKKREPEEPVSGFEAPDMSSLLAPLPASDEFGEATDMPDLSMFEEQPEEEIVEEEPEEPSIADLSLEDLLGGAGFDGTTTPEFDAQSQTPEIDEDEAEFYSGGFGDENYVPKKKTEKDPAQADDELNDLNFYDDTPSDDNGSSGEALSLAELGLGDLENNNEPTQDAASIEDFNIDELSDIDSLEEADSPEATDSLEIADSIEDADSFENVDSLEETETIEEAPSFDDTDISEPLEASDSLETSDSLENLGLDDLDFSEEVSEPDSITESADLSEPFDIDTNFDVPDLGDTQESELDEEADELADNSAEESLLSGADALFDMPETDGDMSLVSEENNPELTEGFGSDFGAAEGLDSMPDFSLDDMDMDSGSMDTAMPDMDMDLDSGSMDAAMPDMNMDLDTSIDDLSSVDDAPAMDDLSSLDSPVEDMTALGDMDIPDDFSADFDDSDSLPEETEENISIETFDTSEMDGLDFSIPETDAKLGGADSGFELGNDDEFSIEGQDFTIPGFSDVETAKVEKSGPILAAKTGKTKAEEDLPPNTLSDAQYKVFLKNLNEYPLNVRLAFEDLIVKNEFTDEAEFEIVEKILNKAPARQVASMLEKMLDISLPVPRNYEHRTAEEYEAYKKSLSYQLKNKIIPAVFACMVLMIVGFGVFKFTKNCIYIPAKASHLYKQGYAMLQADEYPQSEIKFNEAITYRLNKNWFFKYARSYREKKQYIRAEWMYQNILDYFKHNKSAGLEYASMELNDLANYEKAEDICRRQVLDYHINDADGILLLGDIFLEWGTEKDPAKLESAREQYATLIQLYRSNMLYEGRMLRYFIRTDNLPEVLTLKEYFLPKEKNLPPEDWTELSGYMLDKLYGPLAPSDEYLRNYIEDVRLLLTRAYKLDSQNPVSAYNLSRYFIETDESSAAKSTLIDTLDKFKKASHLKRRDLYKYIDTYRLAGEEYAKVQEFLRAQEQFTDGITLYTAERDASGLQGNVKIGQLFADQADMDYFITGDYDNALQNYISSVELENDNPSIRYKIGYIQYKKKNYGEALGSFMKAGDGNIKETNLMLAMGNTLSLRGDNYAAQGYYEDLISNLDRQIEDRGIVLPQTSAEENELITTYLYASNNYGVTLYRLASRTGNSSFNAQAIVQFSQSVRAWDALTRNQETLVRLEGSNLAEENIKYITHPVPDFEPAIYTEIPRTILNNEKISY